MCLFKVGRRIRGRSCPKMHFHHSLLRLQRKALFFTPATPELQKSSTVLFDPLSENGEITVKLRIYQDTSNKRDKCNFIGCPSKSGILTVQSKPHWSGVNQNLCLWTYFRLSIKEHRDKKKVLNCKYFLFCAKGANTFAKHRLVLKFDMVGSSR